MLTPWPSVYAITLVVVVGVDDLGTAEPHGLALFEGLRLEDLDARDVTPASSRIWQE